MSNIAQRISNMSSKVESQLKTVNTKADNIRTVWEGQAQEGFQEAHQELKSRVMSMNSKIKNMKSLAQSLEDSIKQADRDISAKKAQKR